MNLHLRMEELIDAFERMNISQETYDKNTNELACRSIINNGCNPLNDREIVSFCQHIIQHYSMDMSFYDKHLRHTVKCIRDLVFHALYTDSIEERFELFCNLYTYFVTI